MERWLTELLQDSTTPRIEVAERLIKRIATHDDGGDTVLTASETLKIAEIAAIIGLTEEIQRIGNEVLHTLDRM